MLHVYFGYDEEADISLPKYFDYAYEPEWIDSEFGRRIIKEVDKSTVISGRIIESPFLGDILPKEISGGVKSLLLMKFDQYFEGKYFCAHNFGGNTFPFILEIAREKDIYIMSDGPLAFPENMTDTIYIENLKKEVTGYRGYLEAYCEVM